MILLTVLTNCQYTSQSADSQSVLHYLNEAIGNTKICLKDKEFSFPDIIVGPKYSGKSLAQLDALVIAGLLRETEEVIDKPNIGPKYIYHYKQHHQIERRTFYLTDLGSKYYHTDQNGGYFCYGQPDKIQIEAINSTRNKQGDQVLNVKFSYAVKRDPDAKWISNPWIQQEFQLTNQALKKQTAQQQFIKDNENSIKPVSPGIVNLHYW